MIINKKLGACCLLGYLTCQNDVFEAVKYPTQQHPIYDILKAASCAEKLPQKCHLCFYVLFNTFLLQVNIPKSNYEKTLKNSYKLSKYCFCLHFYTKQQPATTPKGKQREHLESLIGSYSVFTQLFPGISTCN